MSIALFSVSLLEALCGCHSLRWPTEKLRPDASIAFEFEYAHRAGYRLTADGEWIANGNDTPTTPTATA